MNRLNKCDLCGSGKLKFLHLLENCNERHNGKLFGLYQCINCGLMFVNPQPRSLKEIIRFHPQSIYYHKIGEIPKGRSKEYEKFMEKLFYFYIKHPFSRNFFYLLFPYVRRIKIIPNGKYLDVGCGGGQFLYQIKKVNPSGEYYGIEPGNFDEEDVKKHKLKVFKGTLEDAHYPDNYFDVITIHSVFEHVYNPSETMRELRKVLKTNGTIIISVPNGNSLALKLFGKYSSQLGISHLFTYSDTTLKKYAEKFNFKIEKVKYGSPLNDAGSFIMSCRIKFGMTRKRRSIPFVIIVFFSAIFFILFFLPILLLNILKFSDSIEIWLKK
ncbi:hypothetical protein MSIBF_A730002 [groundwater metagenome]|uniref:Methyltransferase type 11 n=1 Tax=groundwater metagenome TaxID=717931 RepID=A0A098ED76_9ZZZZ